MPSGLSGVVAIAGGEYHSLALKSDGTVAGPSATISVRAGNNQQALIGTSVPIPPSVVVRDYNNNPVSGRQITFIASSGGGSITGGSQTTNAEGIATVGSWTLGASAGMNTLTALVAGGSAGTLSIVFFTATGKLVLPVISSVPSFTSQSGGSIGPGGAVSITQVLTNPHSTGFTNTYTATLPTKLSVISCSAPFGSCTIGTGPRISSDPGLSGINRKSTLSTQTASQTVTWTGTIPGNGSVTITYLVQVSAQASSGTQYCVTTTINGVTGSPACLTVSTPSSAPGNLPLAAGLSNQQKPGSVLIFNVFTSSSSSSLSDSLISLTNTNPVNPANVHLFFVDGASCTVADQTIMLTQNQTVSFLASDVDPGVTGFIIAVTVDAAGCPAVSNYLVGGSVVRFESGHHASLPAIGVAGLALSTPPCTAGSTTASLAFNGVSYDELPRSLAVHTLPSLANGNSPLLIVNRIGGNLTSGADKIGALAGLLYDDSETARSFTISGGICQLRGILGNNLPRTVPRYTSVIPAGRTGWMKFWTVDEQAISGVMINEAASGLSGGHNLQTLTTTGAATLTIPVIPS